jgi:hypothetical protein
VEKPEFIAMMNHTHHGRGPLKLPKHEGMKRRVMKMGEDTVEGIHEMFSASLLCVKFVQIKLLISSKQELESKVSLSLDAWTSSNGHAFLAIIVHYVTNDGHLGQ